MKGSVLRGLIGIGIGSREQFCTTVRKAKSQFRVVAERFLFFERQKNQPSAANLCISAFQRTKKRSTTSRNYDFGVIIFQGPPENGILRSRSENKERFCPVLQSHDSERLCATAGRREGLCHGRAEKGKMTVSGGREPFFIF